MRELLACAILGTFLGVLAFCTIVVSLGNEANFPEQVRLFLVLGWATFWACCAIGACAAIAWSFRVIFEKPPSRRTADIAGPEGLAADACDMLPRTEAPSTYIQRS